jgi:hypothetical protein
MAEFFHGSPFEYDQVDYYEFTYIFDKMQEEIKERNEKAKNDAAGRTSLDDLF